MQFLYNQVETGNFTITVSGVSLTATGVNISRPGKNDDYTSERHNNYCVVIMISPSPIRTHNSFQYCTSNQLVSHGNNDNNRH